MTAIQQGTAAIPENGFVIVTGVERLVNQFTIGDEVHYELKTTAYSSPGVESDAVDWNREMTTAVSAGPTILREGVIIADGAAEGFTEAKINTTRAQRSFAGVTADQVLVMGTIPNVTLKELGELCLKLNLVNAMNLDGGASSGLYYDGKTQVSPGRLLSNALVVTKANPDYIPPIRVRINGTFLKTAQPPVVIQGATLLPLREVFQALGATVQWDEAARTATAVKDGITIQVPEGKAYVIIDGAVIYPEPSAQLINSQLFVPVRLVAEGFGAQVNWDQRNRIVDLLVEVSE